MSGGELTAALVPGSQHAATETRDTARLNNFDLVRLFGALQVAVVHGTEHLHAFALAPLVDTLGFFPGVPIFFAVSGFLVSLSLERAISLKQYCVNRALRIFPALWACCAISLLIVTAFGVRAPSASALLGWIGSQLTILQFYNPDWLRPFGVGVLNGSLWTIPVELQFYAALPLLALWAGRRRDRWVLLTLGAGILMVALRAWGPARNSPAGKMLSVSLLPYLFFFLVGVLLRYTFNAFPGLFRGRTLVWALCYAVWIALEALFQIPGARGNLLNVVSILLLSSLAISAAFSNHTLSSRLLGTTDISYGLYIYHMPIVNLALVNGIVGTLGVVASLILTTGLAGLSWRFVERPALSLKRYSVRWDNIGFRRAKLHASVAPPEA